MHQDKNHSLGCPIRNYWDFHLSILGRQSHRYILVWYLNACRFFFYNLYLVVNHYSYSFNCIMEKLFKSWFNQVKWFTILVFVVQNAHYRSISSSNEMLSEVTWFKSYTLVHSCPLNYILIDSYCTWYYIRIILLWFIKIEDFLLLITRENTLFVWMSRWNQSSSLNG